MKTLFDIESVQKEFDSMMRWVKHQKPLEDMTYKERTTWDWQKWKRTRNMIEIAREAVGGDLDLYEIYSDGRRLSYDETLTNVARTLSDKIDEENFYYFFSKN